jgi:hypothetical protein
VVRLKVRLVARLQARLKTAKDCTAEWRADKAVIGAEGVKPPSSDEAAVMVVERSQRLLDQLELQLDCGGYGRIDVNDPLLADNPRARLRWRSGSACAARRAALITTLLNP